MTLEENARIHEIFAYDKGVAEGIEQGLTQGRSEEKLEIARNLKDAALPVDLIAKSTGLTIAEVEAL